MQRQFRNCLEGVGVPFTRKNECLRSTGRRIRIVELITRGIRGKVGSRCRGESGNHSQKKIARRKDLGTSKPAVENGHEKKRKKVLQTCHEAHRKSLQEKFSILG